MEALDYYLKSDEIKASKENANSILVQIYSADTQKSILVQMMDCIKENLPQAKIVGTTTVGEVFAGKLVLRQIVISILMFEESEIELLVYSNSTDDEKKLGELLLKDVNALSQRVSGLMLFVTPLTLKIEQIFHELNFMNQTFPVFGGGCGTYSEAEKGMVFLENQFYERAIIGIAFLGNHVEIMIENSLGFETFGNELHVTKALDKTVYEIEHKKSFEIYQKYFDIKKDDNFFQNILEFPLIFNEEDFLMAKVPFRVNEDDSIEFMAEVKEDTTFQIGYGNPARMLKNSAKIQEKFKEFKPDAVLMFSCICRRFLMQDEIDSEMEPFQELATTSGFFTYGEIFSHKSKVYMLNATMVAIGIRETTVLSNGIGETKNIQMKKHVEEWKDIYSNPHGNITARLLRFISRLMGELHRTNQELQELAEKDKLTQVYNRLKLDQVLEAYIARYGYKISIKTFAVVLIDVDYFKRVNDTWGHLAGDQVLQEIALVLKKEKHKNATIGRWGGEEFLVILAEVDADIAYTYAKELKEHLRKHKFQMVGEITCSMGISLFTHGDTYESLMKRADEGLYLAKVKGRDQIFIAKK